MESYRSSRSPRSPRSLRHHGEKTVAELRRLASELQIVGRSKLRTKAELERALSRTQDKHSKSYCNPDNEIAQIDISTVPELVELGRIMQQK